mmetsp:Transcript_27009/g.86831  ORF Transcript_27009/g.86831 Transcript_27009/m.86831 type:complete len:239 (-) Transcript_27009:159-875(-)|eukprot:CAMPEP_0196770310 /NCGR_PEP_ID=MMETSP1104-20130614/1069_1 /TAXON_ID=33652 /ORGANISM="Cafeteria sp., Strain Caron Lab Isolate" /LENGTH=238 /DNA_ID=CAMNT_0042140421 /DNA_START=49 /DNA_END=765 /DNA_ORIENTATION=-
MNLFGRRKAAPKRADPDATAQTIRSLRTTLETLEKREKHIDVKIHEQLETAKKKSQMKDKRGAIFCLKRKKLYEKEVQKIQGARMTLEQQIMSLESATTNMATFEAMQKGASQMKQIHQDLNVDRVDDIMDDINEQMATADEISNAISQPVGSEMFDDEELLEELHEMEGEMMEEQLLSTPSVPASVPAVAAPAAATTLPSVPAPVSAAAAPAPAPVAAGGAAAEDDELAALEASMAV